MVLGSQDALPVATAFTEYVHAYFRGHGPRYAVMGGQGQTGLSGASGSRFQERQPSAVFLDLLYGGRASNSEPSSQAPVLRAVGTTEGIRAGRGLVVTTG